MDRQARQPAYSPGQLEGRIDAEPDTSIEGPRHGNQPFSRRGQESGHGGCQDGGRTDYPPVLELMHQSTGRSDMQVGGLHDKRGWNEAGNRRLQARRAGRTNPGAGSRTNETRHRGKSTPRV